MSWWITALAIIGGLAVFLGLGAFIVSLSELYGRVESLENWKEQTLKRLYDIDHIQNVLRMRIDKQEGVV